LPTRQLASSPVRHLPPSPSKKKRASFWDTLFQLYHFFIRDST
jgi:hypothetical protein